MEKIERIYMEHPLLAFSVYTHIQSEIVRGLGNEVIASLDTAIASDAVDATTINRAYGQFWLWVLGAYEITRTISQAKACFSPRVGANVLDFKQRLGRLRIPFAKQEYAGGTALLGSETSISGIDNQKKDMTFSVQGVVFSARRLVADFDGLISQIKPADVLDNHRSAK